MQPECFTIRLYRREFTGKLHRICQWNVTVQKYRNNRDYVLEFIYHKEEFTDWTNLVCVKYEDLRRIET
jgi:hypothetical protein